MARPPLYAIVLKCYRDDAERILDERGFQLVRILATSTLYGPRTVTHARAYMPHPAGLHKLVKWFNEGFDGETLRIPAPYGDVMAFGSVSENFPYVCTACGSTAPSCEHPCFGCGSINTIVTHLETMVNHRV